MFSMAPRHEAAPALGDAQVEVPAQPLAAVKHIDAATLTRLDLTAAAFGLLQIRNDRPHGTMRPLRVPLDPKTLRRHLDDGRLAIIPAATPPRERQRLLRCATHLRAAAQEHR